MKDWFEMSEFQVPKSMRPSLGVTNVIKVSNISPYLKFRYFEVAIQQIPDCLLDSPGLHCF